MARMLRFIWRASFPETLDPFFASLDDFLHGAPRAHLEDKQHVLRNECQERIVIHVAGEWSHVIAPGPFRIMQMAADEPGSDLFHPFRMIEKAEVMLPLHVAEVMPVADGRLVEFLEDFEHLTLIRNLLERMPA